MYGVIQDRKEHPKEGSYTNYLFDKGIDKILKKVGEEATEVVIAAKNPDPEEIKYELSDFLYHAMVLMVERGVTWEDITAELLDIQQSTVNNTGFIAGVALNYGGRDEITRAARELAREAASGEISPDGITEDSIEKLLYTAEMPPLDMIIRPSGEQRLSNFLIWQAAYAEFVFMDVLWPDFTKKHLEYAIQIYNDRDRRFGGV